MMPIALRSALLGLSLFIVSSANAASVSVCPEAGVFYNQIYNCSKNSVAVTYAQACSDSLMAAAKVQGAALGATMDAMRAQLGSAQSSSMTDTDKRLRMTIQQFSAQIVSMQAATNTVANYTSSMIDYAGGKDDSTSAECFTTNFHALQNIVTGLDNQILKSKAALQAAKNMLSSVDHSAANLDASSVSATAIPVNASGTGSTPSGQSYVPGSDISGTKDVKSK